MQKTFLLIPFIALLVMKSSGFAQQPIFWQMTEKDGLPSNKVFDLFEDRDGYVWIGSQEGLVRYNGYEFKPYTSSFQKSKPLSGISQTSEGTIWVVNFTKQVFYVNGDSLVEFLLDSVFQQNINGHIRMHVDSHLIYFSSYEHLACYSTITNRFVDLDLIFSWPKNKNGIPLSLQAFQSDKGVFTYGVGRFVLRRQLNGRIDTLVHLKNSIRSLVSTSKSTLAIATDELKVVSIDHVTGELVHLNAPVQFEPETEILSIAQDRDEDIWLKTTSGAISIEKNAKPWKKQLHFSNEKISDVLIDKEGAIWFSSLQHGIFIVPEPELLLYNSSNSNLQHSTVWSLSTDEEGLQIGTSNGQFQAFKDSTFQKARSFGLKSEVNGFQKMHNGDVWIYGNHVYSSNKNKAIYFPALQNVKKLMRVTNNCYAAIYGDALSLFKLSEAEELEPWFFSPTLITQRHRSLIDLNGIVDFEADRVHLKLYLASLNGLYVQDSTELKELKNEINQSVLVQSMTNFKQQIFLGTVQQGLYTLENGMLKQFLSKKNLLNASNITSLAVDSTHIWLCADIGVLKIDRKTKELVLIDELQGLPTLNIRDIEIYKNKVWMATQYGLVQFDKDYEPIDKALPLIALEKMEINGVEVFSLKELDFDENSISVTFSPLSFRSRGMGSIKYRLSRGKNEWKYQPASSPTLEFGSLSPGNYQLVALLEIRPGIASENKITIPITINAPLWQQWWFITIIVLFSLIFVVAIFYWQLWVQAKKNRVVEDLRNSQLTALRAQMNPHFAFNALNSIQDFVLLNNVEKVNDYLGKFARIMRKTLDFSNENEVDLEDEIEVLKLYLEFEALRFEENFSYHVHVDRKLLDEDCSLPSLIIQPLLENAIKHGLLHKKGHKKLELNFKNEGQFIVCEIIDNGIGIEASKKLKQKKPSDHKSFGTSAVQNRIRLLNEIYKNKISLEIHQLNHDNGQAAGTSVKLKIPKYNE